MKRLGLFILSAVLIMALGCGGGSGEEVDGVMTMTTSAREVRIVLHGTGITTIDWGDGRSPDICDLIEDEPRNLSRTFSDTTPRTITISGENITGLNCGLNGLTALDVSRNTALKELWCSYNGLTALDVSRNIALKELWCNSNGLTALDVSMNIALEVLFCGDNQITELDVSRNTALKILNCGDILLTALDVSRNTALNELKCFGNLLTATALNALFETLHNNTVFWEYGDEIQKGINIEDNPGSADCDPTIAENKGWTVGGFEGTDLGVLYLESQSEIDTTEREFNNESINDAIITIINALKNKDEAAINKLIHPDLGIIFLTMPGPIWNVVLVDKISFDWSPPGYYGLPSLAVELDDYTVRFESLPQFDCDIEMWDKPAGIYYQAQYDINITDIAMSIVGFMGNYEWSPEEIKRMEMFDNHSQNYHVIALCSIDKTAYLDFVISFINDKWYLTVIDIKGNCGNM